jgi:predicted nucleotidyltransferase
MKFQKKKLKEIAKKYKIADIYLFGSRVLGFERKESDFDIAVRFKGGLPKPKEIGKIYGDLFSELQEVFKGKKIDLVFIQELPLHFQFKILTEGKLIFSENLEDSCNFLERIANLYRDYKFFIDEYFEGILKAPIK